MAVIYAFEWKNVDGRIYKRPMGLGEWQEVTMCPTCGQHQKVLAVRDPSVRIARHLDGRGHLCPQTEVPGSSGAPS